MRLINITAFIISFLFGIFYITITGAELQKVVVYPTDDNKHLFQFRDKVNNCFQLSQNIVKCSNDNEEIPIQV
tara:strand:+ start:1316 stop:1534 length:219 start_codon:yes stop_codon:yes gene_type:complete